MSIHTQFCILEYPSSECRMEMKASTMPMNSNLRLLRELNENRYYLQGIVLSRSRSVILPDSRSEHASFSRRISYRY